jgi:hypothetical protein
MMHRHESHPQSPLSSTTADGASQDPQAAPTYDWAGWDFAALGAFLRKNDEAWVQEASTRSVRSLASALPCPSCGPDASAQAQSPRLR